MSIKAFVQLHGVGATVLLTKFRQETEINLTGFDDVIKKTIKYCFNKNFFQQIWAGDSL